jgi:hypothetical protein
VKHGATDKALRGIEVRDRPVRRIGRHVVRFL